ncbi:MAG: hypothetical protein ACRDVG_06120, partial [Jatrophihabitantaceae bacterium]
EAGALIEAARGEALRIQRAAVDDSTAARAESDARAERDRIAAADAVLAQAEHEADAIRAQSLEQARAEARRAVEGEMAAVAEEGRRTVEASRLRAMELLDAASDSAEEVRSTMRRLIDNLGESLATFTASVGPTEVLRDTVAEMAPPAPPETSERDTGDMGSPEDRRRPLGLMFGARRA